MDKSRVEPIIFFIEKISFSLKLFSGHFYGQSFIKTVRGPYICLSLRLSEVLIFVSTYPDEIPLFVSLFMRLNNAENGISSGSLLFAKVCWLYQFTWYKCFEVNLVTTKYPL